ncbi:MAG TPA: peptide chain release factor-like protein [Verrucomicrobiota bacterium]|nr:peptide chain release factor-like protein [Verrucomicrobiota bacterium]
MAALGVREADLQETFVRSAGRGGQNVNKTSTCVVLLHRPTGIQVKVQITRHQGQNRLLARKLLLDRIEQSRRARAAAEKPGSKRFVAGTANPRPPRGNAPSPTSGFTRRRRCFAAGSSWNDSGRAAPGSAWRVKRFPCSGDPVVSCRHADGCGQTTAPSRGRVFGTRGIDAGSGTDPVP